MKRFGLTCMLKDDSERIREYEEYHANVWPEVVKGCYDAGIRRVFTYRVGTQMFQFIEAVDDFDMERDMAKYMDDPKAKEWDELMRTYQETFPGQPEGTTWVPMEEIYTMDQV